MIAIDPFNGDPCEYNPEMDRPAYIHEAHAQAEWVVGANEQWRLCSECAALPKFIRFKIRKKIQTKKKL